MTLKVGDQTRRIERKSDGVDGPGSTHPRKVFCFPGLRYKEVVSLDSNKWFETTDMAEEDQFQNSRQRSSVGALAVEVEHPRRSLSGHIAHPRLSDMFPQHAETAFEPLYRQGVIYYSDKFRLVIAGELCVLSNHSLVV